LSREKLLFLNADSFTVIIFISIIITKLKNVFVINPLDAQKVMLSQEEADKLYTNAVVRCNVNDGNALNEAIYAKW
jgi:hypothetical protein